MESRINEAIERHNKGYNCAQAVACTYCDLLGYDEDTVFRMLEGFGAGMGGMEATCGALSGAVTLVGLKKSGGMDCSPRTKGGTYKITREMTKRFRETCGALSCRELKGVDTGCLLHSCEECVRDAACIAEEFLFSE